MADGSLELLEALKKELAARTTELESKQQSLNEARWAEDALEAEVAHHNEHHNKLKLIDYGENLEATQTVPTFTC